MAWEPELVEKGKTKKDELEEKYGFRIIGEAELNGLERFLEVTAPFLKMLGIERIFTHRPIPPTRDALGIYSTFDYLGWRAGEKYYGDVIIRGLNTGEIADATALFDNRPPLKEYVRVCVNDDDSCTVVMYDRDKNNFAVGDLTHDARAYDHEDVKTFVLAVVGAMFALAGKPLPPVLTPRVGAVYRDVIRAARVVDIFSAVALRVIKTVANTPMTLPFPIRARCGRAKITISGDTVTVTAGIDRKGSRIIVVPSFVAGRREVEIRADKLPFTVRGEIMLEYRMRGDRLVIYRADGTVVVELPDGVTVKHPNINRSDRICLGDLEDDIAVAEYDTINRMGDLCRWADDVVVRLETMLANPNIDNADYMWGGHLLDWLVRNVGKYVPDLEGKIFVPRDDDDDYYDDDGDEEW